MYTPISWSRTAGAIAALTLALAPPAAAQWIRPQIGFAGGMAIPTGDYRGTGGREGFSPGVAGTGLLFLRVRGFPAQFRLDASYASNGANDRLKADLLGAFGQSTDERTTLLGGNLDAQYPVALRVLHLRPYIVGGAGMYRTLIAVTAAGSSGSSVGYRFSWNAGGVAFDARRVSVFLEARSVSVAAGSGFAGMTFIPLMGGIRLGRS